MAHLLGTGMAGGGNVDLDEDAHRLTGTLLPVTCYHGTSSGERQAHGFWAPPRHLEHKFVLWADAGAIHEVFSTMDAE